MDCGMTGHDVCQLCSLSTGAALAPHNPMAVAYAWCSTCGVGVAMCEAGVQCMAGCGAVVCTCVHVSGGRGSTWIQEGFDAAWCNLVVPSPMGLVCTYAMGSAPEMPLECCQLACEICAWWPCVHNQHPCTCGPLPDTTHHDSSQVQRA